MTRPRKKSATASDAINQFWMFFSDFSVIIAIMTSIFPTTIMIIKRVTTIDANTIWGRLYPLGYITSWMMVVFGFVSFVEVKCRLYDEFPTVARNSSVVLSEINAMLIYDALRLVGCSFPLSLSLLSSLFLLFLSLFSRLSQYFCPSMYTGSRFCGWGRLRWCYLTSYSFNLMS